MTYLTPVYAFSQWKYQTGPTTYTVAEDGIYLCLCEEINGEASSYGETATITTSATQIDEDYLYSNYNQSADLKRNMAIRVAAYSAQTGDTFTFTNAMTRNYQNELHIVFKVVDTPPTEVDRAYFRSSSDNTGILVSDTLTLTDLPAGLYFAFFQESRNENGASTTLSITNADDDQIITPLTLTGSGTNSMSVGVFGIENTTTVVINSTNSGGSSYASKLYGIYRLGDYSTLGTYDVEFDPNGGSGYMSDQTIYRDTPTPLQTCAYTKAGYLFAGWSTSPDGIVVFDDMESVTNLADENDTITLYAIWEREVLKFVIQINNSENNRAVKDLVDVITTTGVLKDNTSIIDPVIIINQDLTTLRECNYVTISKFKRSYFIKDIVSIRQDIVELTLHVDVLSSFLDELKDCSGIVRRQENVWNLYLNDGVFKTYANNIIACKAFSSGFSTLQFVLAMAGS